MHTANRCAVLLSSWVRDSCRCTHRPRLKACPLPHTHRRMRACACGHIYMHTHTLWAGSYLRTHTNMKHGACLCGLDNHTSCSPTGSCHGRHCSSPHRPCMHAMAGFRQQHRRSSPPYPMLVPASGQAAGSVALPCSPASSWPAAQPRAWAPQCSAGPNPSLPRTPKANCSITHAFACLVIIRP